MKGVFDPAVPPNVYADPALGQVVSAAKLEFDGAIEGSARFLYLVNHYAPAGIVRFEDHGDHIRTFVNSYLLGLVKDAFLLFQRAEDPARKADQVSLIAQRFFAERLLSHSENEIGRVLFLESVFSLDEVLREVIERADQDPYLKTARDVFISISSDLLMFHEFGHGAQQDRRFHPYCEAAIDALKETDAFNSMAAHEQAWVKEETFADAFAINTVLARYADEYDGDSLKAYVQAALTLLFRFLILDQLAIDALHNNVDDMVDIDGIERGIAALVAREHACCAYLAAFQFGSETVQATGSKLPEVSLPEDLLPALTRTDPMIFGRDPHHRRMASLVSLGFADPKGFSAIVDVCRTGWEFPKWL